MAGRVYGGMCSNQCSGLSGEGLTRLPDQLDIPLAEFVEMSGNCLVDAFGAKAAARRQDDRSGWVQSEMTDGLFPGYLALHDRMADWITGNDDAAGGEEFLHAIAGDEDAGGLLSQ